MDHHFRIAPKGIENGVIFREICDRYPNAACGCVNMEKWVPSLGSDIQRKDKIKKVL